MSTPIKPDYQVRATMVTFRADTRTEAVRSLAEYLDDESRMWVSSEPMVIETGYATNHDFGPGKDYWASAMRSYKHKP